MIHLITLHLSLFYVSLKTKEKGNTIKEHISYGEKITRERLKSYNKKRQNKYQSTIIDLVEGKESKGTKVEIIIPIVK